MFCVGIDQSYTNTGIAVSKDGILLSATSFKPIGCTKAEKRLDVYSELIKHATELKEIAGSGGVCFVYERIRTYGNMGYILATAPLCGTIQEVSHEMGFACYSVDTRAWKKAVVGKTEKQENNEKIQPEKYPTILWGREQAAIKSDTKDNDLCDAAAISQTWWKCRDKLKDEMK